MSLPTSFDKLAISGMPPTPSSTAGHSPTKDDPVSSSEESSGSEDGSDEDSDTSTSGILTSSNTRLQYNASRLTPTTSSRARAGLTSSNFKFTACSFYNDPPPPYFGFQISEPTNFVVRVGAPGSQYATLTCTCGDQTPCRHIFFLLDQIANHTLTEKQKKAKLPLSRDGVLQETLDVFQQIKAAGPTLFEKLERNSTTASGDGGENPEPQANSVQGAARVRHVRDILASFSKTDSTDDYRSDIFDNIRGQPASGNHLYPEDLEKALAYSMITNDALFDQMRDIVPPKRRASAYFNKKCQKALEAFNAMDDYTKNKRKPQDSPTPDVAWCAKVVQDSVSDIMARINKAQSPLHESARKSAAQALTQILHNLSERNVDIYNRPVWRHAVQQALDIKDRNIFLRFYRTIPEDGSKFILDDLSSLADALLDYRDLIEEAADVFGEAYQAKQIPKAYSDRIQRLASDWRGTRTSRNKSGSKRPGDESGGDNKRMK